MHNKHVMIDIETLSTENDAAIIAVGAVEFDLDNMLQERIWTVDPRLSPGRRDEETLAWWKKQDPNTAGKMWGGTDSSFDVAREFGRFMLPFWDTHWIWAYPITFDLSIIQTWFRGMGFSRPTKWRMARDVTTLIKLADQLGIDYSGDEFVGFEAHNALHDCMKQARRVQIILKEFCEISSLARNSGPRA